MSTFKKAERQYGYRTPDGVDHEIDDSIAEWANMAVKEYVAHRAEVTEGVVITRTVTTMITPWAAVEEAPDDMTDRQREARP